MFQQKPIRRRIASLEKQNNPEFQFKIEQDKQCLEEMEAILKKEMGSGKYYIGLHPILGSSQVALDRKA